MTDPVTPTPPAVRAVDSPVLPAFNRGERLRSVLLLDPATPDGFRRIFLPVEVQNETHAEFWRLGYIAGIAARSETEWFPIGTAPLDRDLLLWTGRKRVVGAWEARGAYWADEHGGIVRATHWQPLSTPPETGS